MEGKGSKEAEPVLGETMQRFFDPRPRFRKAQHLVAVGIVFGVTLTSMYFMRENIEETMPWKARK